MIEVDVRNHEFAAILQKPFNFGEFMRLMASYVFKDALGQNDVEPLTSEYYGCFDKVRLKEVGRGIMDRDVDAVIPYILVEKAC